ncbi:biofilm development regulator YmgB/AriR family protein [Pantoea rwandensis]|uniref:Two-component-system connector protein AriR n=1 Tax=Pantoea rwandensis TaxID=1076550 RepID=A0A1X1CSG0_9GAMM|nr:biofilm development regulator YmgB/AriR family protein [Pantoea rwandensis]ORM67362.1 two-component-system connector protein AriR [Pantoea rwandensis]
MQNPEEIYSALPDIELAEFLRNAGPDHGDEVAVLDIVIRSVLASEGKISNKSIIISLIRALECVDDEAQAAVLRRTLEIVVGYTPDD